MADYSIQLGLCKLQGDIPEKESEIIDQKQKFSFDVLMHFNTSKTL